MWVKEQMVFLERGGCWAKPYQGCLWSWISIFMEPKPSQGTIVAQSASRTQEVEKWQCFLFRINSQRCFSFTCCWTKTKKQRVNITKYVIITKYMCGWLGALLSIPCDCDSLALWGGGEPCTRLFSTVYFVWIFSTVWGSGGLCLTFLHCVFSWLFSSVTFLHCVFSKVAVWGGGRPCTDKSQPSPAAAGRGEERQRRCGWQGGKMSILLWQDVEPFCTLCLQEYILHVNSEFLSYAALTCWKYFFFQCPITLLWLSNSK